MMRMGERLSREQLLQELAASLAPDGPEQVVTVRKSLQHSDTFVWRDGAWMVVSCTRPDSSGNGTVTIG